MPLVLKKLDRVLVEIAKFTFWGIYPLFLKNLLASKPDDATPTTKEL